MGAWRGASRPEEASPEIRRQEYNYFLDDNGFGDTSVRVRVTAIDGQVIEDDLPAV